MNNIPSQDNNLNQSLNFDSGNNLTKSPSKCIGKGCENFGKTLLKINYINKTGYFCDNCAEDLLHEELAVKAGNLL